ncbi:MAG TPA: DUF4190 domain-containing protein [Micromonospora sp.]
MSYPPPGEPQEPQQPPPPYGRQPEEPGGPWGQYGPSGVHGPQGQQYGAAGQYGQPPGPPAGGRTNVLAILSLVLAFVFAPAGIVLGHLAKRQIRQTGEPGDQLATWGLVLSYVFTALWVIGCCAWLGLILWAGPNNNNY